MFQIAVHAYIKLMSLYVGFYWIKNCNTQIDKSN